MASAPRTSLSSQGTKLAIVKEQLAHMLAGTAIFIVVGALAIGLDLLSQRLPGWGVSGFVSITLLWAAHGLFLVDLVLFVAYIAKSSIELLKEIFR